jgi:hypothetical protein
MTVSAIADKDGTTEAAQPGAKEISTAKVSAKDASPTSMTIDETRLKFREKNILSIDPLPLSAMTDYSLPAFFAVN